MDEHFRRTQVKEDAQILFEVDAVPMDSQAAMEHGVTLICDILLLDKID